jgi:hypothetical protein
MGHFITGFVNILKPIAVLKKTTKSWGVWLLGGGTFRIVVSGGSLKPAGQQQWRHNADAFQGEVLALSLFWMRALICPSP